MLKINKQNSGFTLVEMLLAIAIIGLLISIATVQFGNVRARTRDAGRSANLKTIQAGLEAYKNGTGHYPSPTDFNSGTLSATSGSSTIVYLQKVPLAPSVLDGTCLTSAFVYATTTYGYGIDYCLGSQVGDLVAGNHCLSEQGDFHDSCYNVLLAPACSTATVCGDRCSYGTENYSTININGQCWFQKNLDIGTMLCANNIGGSGCSVYQTDNGAIEKNCYNNDPNNCAIYGGLYQWDEAMQYSTSDGAQGICPDGWHIPSGADQNTLVQYLTDTSCDFNNFFVYSDQGCENAGSKLKLGGASGFNALLSGVKSPYSAFFGQTESEVQWNSSFDSGNPRPLTISRDSAGVSRWQTYSTNLLSFSVRCLKN